MQVSVIIPTFNRREVLGRALESVARQTYKDWELIVIDDGSSDDTGAFVARWIEAKNLPQAVKFAKKPNAGVSSARNQGARMAEAPWLAFLDSDDEWLEDKLEKQIALTGEYLLIHGEEIWMRKGVRVNPMKKHVKAHGRVFSRCVDLCFISPSTVMIEKDLFLSLGGFRENFPVCEDYELWLRIASKHSVGMISSPTIIKYGGNSDQLSLNFPAMDYFRVQALVPFLDNESLSGEERQHVVASMISRSEILLKGYRKHTNAAHQKDIENWRQLALNTFTQLHKTHSAADLLPRSEDTLNL